VSRVTNVWVPWNAWIFLFDYMTSLRAVLLGSSKNYDILSKTSKYELFILR